MMFSFFYLKVNMFVSFLVSNPRILNLIKIILEKMISSNHTPKFIKKIAGVLVIKLITSTLPKLFECVAKQASKNPSERTVRAMTESFGYRVADHVKSTQRVAIMVELNRQELECKSRKCVMSLKGESCSPFETIYCETCDKNICSLEVPYMTEPFYKKYMGLK